MIHGLKLKVNDSSTITYSDRATFIEYLSDLVASLAHCLVNGQFTGQDLRRVKIQLDTWTQLLKDLVSKQLIGAKLTNVSGDRLKNYSWWKTEVSQILAIVVNMEKVAEFKKMTAVSNAIFICDQIDKLAPA